MTNRVFRGEKKQPSVWYTVTDYELRDALGEYTENDRSQLQSSRVTKTSDKYKECTVVTVTLTNGRVDEHGLGVNPVDEECDASSKSFQDIALLKSHGSDTLEVVCLKDSVSLLNIDLNLDFETSELTYYRHISMLKDMLDLQSVKQNRNNNLKIRKSNKKRKLNSTQEQALCSPVAKIPLDYKNVNVVPVLKVYSTNDDVVKWELALRYVVYYKLNDFNSYSSETLDFIRGETSPQNMVQITNTPTTGNGTQRNANVRQMFEESIIEHTREKFNSIPKKFVLTDVQKDSLYPLQLLPFQENTVSWMVSKEQFANEKLKAKTKGLDILGYLNEYVAYGYIELSTIGYYNVLTEYLLSYKTAEKYFSEFMKLFDTASVSHPLTENIGAKGLLCEEMGLGKTIELLSLILLNPRHSSPILNSHVNTNKIGKNNYQYYKGETTLIVTPESILGQWVDELTLHSPRTLKIYHYKGFNSLKKEFPDITPQLIARNLSTYDIVITSYHTISSELHYTEFSRNNYHYSNLNNNDQQGSERHELKYDYSSPLGLIQFWRIVLDEVQSLGRSLNNNIIKCLNNLQRVHTWGCSGTPIVSNEFNKSVCDLLTILAYLKITPFQSQSISKKILTLVKSNSDMINVKTNLIQDVLLKFDIPVRHSKQLVLDQINIPEQKKYLIPLNLQHIEQDKYKNLFRNFLQECGYTQDGSLRNASRKPDNDLLNKWLKELQLACINIKPNLITHTRSSKHHHNGHKLGSLADNIEQIPKTSMEDILQEMKTDIQSEIDNSIKDQISKLMYRGRYELESLQKPEEGMATIRRCIDMIHQEQNDTQNLQNDTYHVLLNLLHQAFFFLATGYYMLGSERLEKNEELIKDPEEMEKIVECQKQEEHYYNEAELIRRKLLRNRIENVDYEVQKFLTSKDLNKKITNEDSMIRKIEFIENDNFSTDLLMDKLFKNMSYIFKTLNEQVELIEKYVFECEELLVKPILLDDSVADDLKAKEYESSIDAQDIIFSKFDCIETMLSNRSKVIDEKTLEPIKFKVTTIKQYSKQHQQLLKSLPIVQGFSLKMIFNQIENIRIVKNYRMVNDFEYYLLEYSKGIPQMIKEISLVKDHLKVLNQLYNARTEYYSSLQRISDSLIPLYQLELPVFQRIESEYRNFDNLWESKSNSQNSYKSRLKYLETLQRLRSNEKLTCLICLDTIKLGSMIKCGHFYCKHCIGEWFKQKSKSNLKCPICAMKISSLEELYDFKFVTSDDDINTSICPRVAEENVQNSTDQDSHYVSTTSNLFGDYERCPDLSTLMKLKIEVDLGSKINAVFKILKFIQLQHGDLTQTLIYTSNLDHMVFLKSLLKNAGIPTLSTMGLLQTEFNHTISQFKKSTDYKVLILNSKRQVAGLTLVNASHIIFLDPVINNSDELQAINRINRIGQTKETYVWTLMVQDTVEENILRYKSSLEKSFTMNGSELPKKKTHSKHHSQRAQQIQSSNIGQEHIWNFFFHLNSSS